MIGLGYGFTASGFPRKWMSQSSFELVKPVLPYCAWWIVQIADWFCAHDTLFLRKRNMGTTIPRFRSKCLKKPWILLSTGFKNPPKFVNLLSLNQGQHLIFLVATIRSYLSQPGTVNRWFTRSARWLHRNLHKWKQCSTDFHLIRCSL